MRKSWYRCGEDKKLWAYFTWGTDYGWHPGFECGFGWKPKPLKDDMFLREFAFAMDVVVKLPRVRINWGWPWLRISRRK